MNMILTFEDGETIETTLEMFLTENEIDGEERADIMDTIMSGSAYVGGGGAQPEWTLETAL